MASSRCVGFRLVPSGLSLGWDDSSYSKVMENQMQHMENGVR